MFRVIFLAFIIAAIAYPALAQPSAAVRQACEADYHRFCATVIPGDGRILRCLTDRDKDLAPDCRSALRLLPK